MTNDEKRIAIAEACGWTAIHFCESEGHVGLDPADKRHRVIPDYLADLNAIHEAERALNTSQIQDYIESVRQICGMEMESDIPTTGFPMFATAAQRVEAFLATIKAL